MDLSWGSIESRNWFLRETAQTARSPDPGGRLKRNLIQVVSFDIGRDWAPKLVGLGPFSEREGPRSVFFTPLSLKTGKPAVLPFQVGSREKTATVDDQLFSRQKVR